MDHLLAARITLSDSHSRVSQSVPGQQDAQVHPEQREQGVRGCRGVGGVLPPGGGVCTQGHMREFALRLHEGQRLGGGSGVSQGMAGCELQGELCQGG